MAERFANEVGMAAMLASELIAGADKDAKRLGESVLNACRAVSRHPLDPEINRTFGIAYEQIDHYFFRGGRGRKARVERRKQLEIKERTLDAMLELAKDVSPTTSRLDDDTPPRWALFDKWAAEHLTSNELLHVRQLYRGPVPNDALGAIQGCDIGEASRVKVNRLNSDIRRKLPVGYTIKSDGARKKPGQTSLFGP